MGSKTAARAAAVRAGVPVVPGHARSASAPTSPTAALERARARDRLSAARQGRVGRRRQGHAHGRRSGGSRRRRARRALGSRRGIRRRRGVPRAAPDAAAPHRSAAARRPARHGPAVRRARMLDPAAASEGRRGDAVGGRDAGAATGAGRGGRRRRARGRLHQRRHDRVPARRGRAVLLPRDEHAAAGRASDHRDGDRASISCSGRFASRAASGSISIRTRLLTPKGHAIECRIYAEDPDNDFLPSPGRILALRAPAGPGIRDDSGATAGLDVPIFYDPMISKLVAWAEDRPRAIARMRRALGEYVVAGIRTTVPFFTWLLEQPEFAAGRFHTTFLDEILASRNGRPFVEPTPEVEEIAVIAAALQAMLSPGGPADADGPSGAAISRWRDQARVEGAGAPGRIDRDLRYEIEAGGRVRHVTVTPHGRRFCSQRRWTPPSGRRCAHRRAHAVADRGQGCGRGPTGLRGDHRAGGVPRNGSLSWSARCRSTVTAERPPRRRQARRRGAAAAIRAAADRRPDARQSRAGPGAGRRRRPRPSAGRRRRSHEDGERVARRPRRHGGRNPHPRRDVGRRRRAARS